MAFEATTAPVAAGSEAPPSGPRGNNRGGRGRGRGRPNGANNGEGRRGARGGSRGGAQQQSKNNSGGTMSAADLSAKFSQSNGQSVAAPLANPQVEDKEGEEDVEAEVCFICASLVVHNSVAPCNHRTCHICAIRMRALYKTKDCAHCRTEAQYVIFTDDAVKRFEDFTDTDLVETNESIGIKFENSEAVEDTLLLLRYNCPDSSCDVACLGWPDLHRHVRSVHHKKMCDLCTRNKKVFTHEHELFTDKELERHMKKGDDNPGAIDQSGFRGHPLCGFCGQRFYGDDELYVHCRAKHERCFICDRVEGSRPQYYLNYETLEQHFKKDHFLCTDRECLEKKFIVFSSELDLKAHQLEEHGSTLSKDVRRDARTVDISSFDYRAPYVQERRAGGSQREGREGRGRGRGRDPNAEPIPASSAQPMRRDELAYQRQMAIHSAQSVSNRTFGGQLTAAPPSERAHPASTTAAPPTNVSAVAAQMSNVDLSMDSANLTPQEQARRLRHSHVIGRASTLLQNDQLKLNQFRSSISQYQRNTMTAAALIDSFFALFSDTSSTALGSLVREVADLYEDKPKAEALRTAWNDWRAINEDYPSLPGPSGMSGSLPLGWAQVTASTPSSSNTAPPKSTSRVLKLKSSTAQSSRSQNSRSQSWGSGSAADVPFPGLPPSSGPAPRVAPLQTRATPWLNVTSGGSASSSQRPTPPSSRPVSRGPPRGGAGPGDFPSLPAAPKPVSTIFGYGTGMVRRDHGSGQSSSFSWGGSGVGSADASAAASESEGTGQGKKKGNKGKKQVLVQWG